MSLDDWRPTASLDTLRARARLLNAVRRFFIDRSYLEVETPLLSRDTCIDTWVDPVAVPHPTQPGRSLYLQTSPEFSMKRLLAAGADAIFEITRSFRQGESGPRHNLEFTILEWYRAGDTHHDQMTVVEDLIQTIAALPFAANDLPQSPITNHQSSIINPALPLSPATNSPTLSSSPNGGEDRGEGAGHPSLEIEQSSLVNESPIQASPAPSMPNEKTENRNDKSQPAPFPRFTYDEAALSALGTTLLDKSTTDLREITRSSGIAIPASLPEDDRDGWLNLLLAERIEPWLAQLPACFLYDYPASQAALAKVRRGPPDVAERFELYLGGIELCNGYHELTDPDELKRRMGQHNAARIADRSDPLPTDSRLIAAMRHGLPDCSGVALGFDRLVMWKLRLADLRQVLAFPFERA